MDALEISFQKLEEKFPVDLMLAIKDRAKEKTREKYDTANFML
jgi:hypothetical protein